MNFILVKLFARWFSNKIFSNFKIFFSFFLSISNASYGHVKQDYDYEQCDMQFYYYNLHNFHYK